MLINLESHAHNTKTQICAYNRLLEEINGENYYIEDGICGSEHGILTKYHQLQQNFTDLGQSLLDFVSYDVVVFNGRDAEVPK